MTYIESFKVSTYNTLSSIDYVIFMDLDRFILEMLSEYGEISLHQPFFRMQKGFGIIVCSSVKECS